MVFTKSEGSCYEFQKSEVVGNWVLYPVSSEVKLYLHRWLLFLIIVEPIATRTAALATAITKPKIAIVVLKLFSLDAQ